MSVLHSLASILDGVGLRPLVARLASAAYRGQTFSVDSDGRWVNAAPDAVFVSPTIYTVGYAALRESMNETWFWRTTPRAGDIVIDIGAGIGEEAVVFSRLVGPTGRVISIEAQPSTFRCLEETVRRSGLTNVTAVNCAIADADGELTIADGDNHLKSSVVTGSGGVRVPARSLDSLLAELGVDRVDFLKMNIEGAERLAVRGMAKVLAGDGAVVISCHDFLSEGGRKPEMVVRAEVESVLRDAGLTLEHQADDPRPWVRDYVYGSHKAAA